MKKTVTRKFRSNEGATLAMALMLFLVCAVIGMIILTAGTIAAGRLADKAEMDQRYYLATSTADLIENKINTKESVVIREKITTYNLDKTLKKVDYDLIYDGNGDGESDEHTDFLSECASLLLKTNEENEEMWSSEFNNSGNQKSFDFYVVPNGATTPLKTIKVDSVAENGAIVLIIYSNETGEDKYLYRIRMTLCPDVSESYSYKETEGLDKPDDAGPVIKKIETKQATVKWSVSAIEKVYKNLKGN